MTVNGKPKDQPIGKIIEEGDYLRSWNHNNIYKYYKIQKVRKTYVTIFITGKTMKLKYYKSKTNSSFNYLGAIGINFTRFVTATDMIIWEQSKFKICADCNDYYRDTCSCFQSAFDACEIAAEMKQIIRDENDNLFWDRGDGAIVPLTPEEIECL
jgi:hypothetical protein